MSEDLTRKLPQGDSNKLDVILNTVQRLEGRIERLENRVNNIDSRLQRLEQRVEERLYDTRPIWHRVVADIGQLQTSHQRLHNGQQSLETSVQRLEEGQQYLRTLILELNGSMRGVNHDLRGIENRLHRLEADR